MNLILEALKTVNMAVILFREFRIFIEIHQKPLEPFRDRIFDEIRSFFSHGIFPLAEIWINNISTVSTSEVSSTLNITIAPDLVLCEEDKAKVFEKIKMSEKINDVIVLKEMLKRTGNFRNNYSFHLRMFLPLWWMGVKEAWHKVFLEAFMMGSRNGFLKKLEIPSGVVNMTNKEIPDTLLNILSKGSKYIPQVHKDAALTIKRVETEIIDHALWYSRKVEKKAFPVPRTSARKTLLFLESEAKTNKDRIFYRTLLDGLPDVRDKITYNLANSTREEDISSIKALESLSVIEGCVWNQANKNHGLVLLPAKFVQETEVKVMEKLDAVKIDKSPLSVIKEIVYE